MFNIFSIAKKFIGNGKKEDAVPVPVVEGNQIKLSDKIQRASDFVNDKFKESVTEYGVIREKFKDLSKTNYDLGLKYLEKGNLSEAIFRFKIVKKFWPNNHEAYCQLAYCLILSNKFDKAEEVIKELLEKNPNYEERAMTLLNSINEARQKELAIEENSSDLVINNDNQN